MTSENAKSAHGVHALRKVDQLAGPITSEDMKILKLLQVSRLTQRFALTSDTAATVAELAFGGAA